MTTLYKTTAADGGALHGGAGSWPLPADGQPGAWREETGPLVQCRSGLHLTDDPARWWAPGCRVWLAEADGVIGSCDDDEGRKVVARRARLVREVTDAADLATLRIYVAGEHRTETVAVATDRATVEAYGIATVRASGNATVRASGNATVEAYGIATVRASDRATVEASGIATVRAYGSATVRATGSATVGAYDRATVEASGIATVRAYGSATVRAYGSATVRASGSATVEATDSATVRASGSATVEATDSATVRASGNATVRASDRATVEAYDSATVEATDRATVVSWGGRPGVRIDQHAVWIERGDESGPPKVHVARAPAEGAPECACGHPVLSADPVCQEWGPGTDEATGDDYGGCHCTDHEAAHTPETEDGRNDR